MNSFTVPPELKPVITICIQNGSISSEQSPVLYGHSSSVEPIMISPMFIALAANSLYAFMLNTIPEAFQNDFLEFCKDVNLEMWSKEDVGEKLLYYSSFGNNIEEIKKKIEELGLDPDYEDDEEDWKDE